MASRNRRTRDARKSSTDSDDIFVGSAPAEPSRTNREIDDELRNIEEMTVINTIFNASYARRTQPAKSNDFPMPQPPNPCSSERNMKQGSTPQTRRRVIETSSTERASRHNREPRPGYITEDHQSSYRKTPIPRVETKKRLNSDARMKPATTRNSHNDSDGESDFAREFVEEQHLTDEADEFLGSSHRSGMAMAEQFDLTYNRTTTPTWLRTNERGRRRSRMSFHSSITRLDAKRRKLTREERSRCARRALRDDEGAYGDDEDSDNDSEESTDGNNKLNSVYGGNAYASQPSQLRDPIHFTKAPMASSRLLEQRTKVSPNRTIQNNYPGQTKSAGYSEGVCTTQNSLKSPVPERGSTSVSLPHGKGVELNDAPSEEEMLSSQEETGSENEDDIVEEPEDFAIPSNKEATPSDVSLGSMVDSSDASSAEEESDYESSEHYNTEDEKGVVKEPNRSANYSRERMSVSPQQFHRSGFETTDITNIEEQHDASFLKNPNTEVAQAVETISKMAKLLFKEERPACSTQALRNGVCLKEDGGSCSSDECDLEDTDDEGEVEKEEENAKQCAIRSIEIMLSSPERCVESNAESNPKSSSSSLKDPSIEEEDRENEPEKTEEEYTEAPRIRAREDRSATPERSFGNSNKSSRRSSCEEELISSFPIDPNTEEDASENEEEDNFNRSESTTSKMSIESDVSSASLDFEEVCNSKPSIDINTADEVSPPTSSDEILISDDENGDEENETNSCEHRVEHEVSSDSESTESSTETHVTLMIPSTDDEEGDRSISDLDLNEYNRNATLKRLMEETRREELRYEEMMRMKAMKPSAKTKAIAVEATKKIEKDERLISFLQTLRGPEAVIHKRQTRRRPFKRPLTKFEKMMEKMSKYPKNLLDPENNFKTKKFATVIEYETRPVIYRILNLPFETTIYNTDIPLNVHNLRGTTAKRTRVTRQVSLHKVLQFHSEDPDTTVYRYVKELDVSETVKSYLETACKLLPKSDYYFDEYVATALEYDNSVKLLHFGRSMKKHSCKQKRMKFQTAWWERERVTFQKPRLGALPAAEEPVYGIEQDPVLYNNHFLVSPYQSSELQKVVDLLIPRLTERRIEDDIIADSTYFVREFFLQKNAISFRIRRSSDFPACFVPPTLDCGYFPSNAKTEYKQMIYLKHRYNDAQIEYANLIYTSTTPGEGFCAGEITAEELYKFHKLGRHIHGFFVVWESESQFHFDKDDHFNRKRYLVDIFFLQKFPIDIEYEQWSTQLRVAFDKTVIYILHFSEILRVNRVVFNQISQNPSFHQPLSMAEIHDLMDEQAIKQRHFMGRVGEHEFYDTGRSSTNKSYLSAFFIICGGTKVLKSIYDDDLQLQVLPSCGRFVQAVTLGGQVLVADSKATPIEDFDRIYSRWIGEEVEEVEEVGTEQINEIVRYDSTNPLVSKTLQHVPVVKPGSEEAEKITRVVSDMKKKTPVVTVLKKKTVYKRDTFEKRLTRRELIKVRKNMYNFEYPPKEQPKKPAKPARKRPGRKPETLLDKSLKKHDFAIRFIPSDVESEYEGYLSEKEEFRDEAPTLIRSQSSESIFMDVPYKENRFDFVSSLHKYKLNRPEYPFAKKKRRKMNRIIQKHIVNFGVLEVESLAFKEMLECYHGTMPRTAEEIAKTKNCIRNPHRFKKFNIPSVYGPGDAPLVDAITNALKEMVSLTVGMEHANMRAGNGIIRLVHEISIERLETIENLGQEGFSDLPEPEYLAMEYLTMERIHARDHLELRRRELRENVQQMVDRYLKLPCFTQVFMMRKVIMRRADAEFEDWRRYEVKRPKQLEKILRRVNFEQRSLEAQNRRDDERRLARRAHAEKAAARAKLPKAEQLRLQEQDREERAAQEKERRRLQVMERKKKLLDEQLVKSRLDDEAKRDREVEVREKKERQLHKKRQLDALMIAQRERHDNYFDYIYSERREEDDERRMQERELQYLENLDKPKKRTASEIRDYIRKKLERSDHIHAENEYNRDREFEQWEYDQDMMEQERREREHEWLMEMKRKRRRRKRRERRVKKKYAKLSKRIDFNMRLLNMKNAEYGKHDEAASLLTILTHPSKYWFPAALTSLHMIDLQTMFSENAPMMTLVLEVCPKNAAQQLFNLIENLTDTNAPGIVISKRLWKLYKLIASCFTCEKIGDVGFEWTCEINANDLLLGVAKYLRMRPRELVTAIDEYKEEVKEEPLRTSCKSIMAEIIKKAIINAEKRARDSHASKSPFWKLIDAGEKVIENESERLAVHQQILNYFKSNQESAEPSVVWMYGILGTCFVIITKIKPVDNQKHDRDDLQMERNDTCIEQILRNLTIVASYFHNASERPEKLQQLLNRNGFSQVFDSFSKLLLGLHKEVKRLTLHFYVCQDGSICEAVKETFKHIGDRCENLISTHYSISPKVMSILRSSENVTANRILNNQKYPDDLRFKQKYRVNTLIEWYHSLYKHHASKLEEIEKSASLLTRSLYDEELENCDYRVNLDKLAKINQQKQKIEEVRKLVVEEIQRKQEEEFRRKLEEENQRKIEEEKKRKQDKENRRKQEEEDQQKKEWRAMRKKRADEIRDENNAPTRLPNYYNSFIQRVWKTLEQKFRDLTYDEIGKIDYQAYNEHHSEYNLNNLHALIWIGEGAKIKYQKHDSADTTDFGDWAHYKRIQVAQTIDDCADHEEEILSYFENTILGPKTFGKMKWEVPRENGNAIPALDFFTDLKKYRCQTLYKQTAATGFLPIKFNVYRQAWFMGALLHESDIIPRNVHDDTADGYCGGCTKGAVVIVKKCICKYYDRQTENRIYATSTHSTVGEMRLLGRFVCEHGPSSTLILYKENEHNEVRKRHEEMENKKSEKKEKDWAPDGNRFFTVDTRLRVIKRRTMYKDLLKATENYVECVKKRNSPSCPPSRTESIYSTHSPSELERVENKRMRADQLFRNRMCREKRSRSAEPVIREEIGSIYYQNVSQSLLNLSDLTKYAAKKARRTVKKVIPKISKDDTTTTSLLENELIDGFTLFSGVSNVSSREKRDAIASMLQCGFKEDIECTDDFEAITDLYKKCGLHQLHGRGVEYKPVFVLRKCTEATKISPVSDEYYNFLIFKTNIMNDSDWFDFKEFTDDKYVQFKELRFCYEKIFAFNAYLFEHFIDIMISRVFNPCAVYCAESLNNVEDIKKNLERVKVKIHHVAVQLFNKSPIRRLFNDLYNIRDKYAPGELKSHVASLCRYAIERIRVPQTVHEELNQYTWINMSLNHGETYEAVDCTANRFHPWWLNRTNFYTQAKQSHFDCEMLREQSESFFSPPGSLFRNILRAFYGEGESFHDGLCATFQVPDIDRKIQTLYHYQAFQRLLEILVKKRKILTSVDVQRLNNVTKAVLISAYMENPKKADIKVPAAFHLDQFYRRLCLIPASSMPIQPPIIGTSFAVFKTRLIFSVVREKEIITAGDFVTDFMIDNRNIKQMRIARDAGIVINSPENNELYICYQAGQAFGQWIHRNNSFKNDWFYIDISLTNWSTSTDESRRHEIRRQMPMNELKKYLNEIQISSTFSTNPPLGRLENLELRKPLYKTPFVKQLYVEHVPRADESDTDAE